MKNYKQVNEFHCTIDEPVFSNDRLSNCCSAPVAYDSDLCSSCFEHCTLVCPECENGFVIDRRRQHSSTIIDMPYTKCKNCQGTGEVENE